jgi:UDP-N-acetylmuramate dehydrogenase
VEVELELTPGREEEIRASIADFTQRRESKQPLEMPSAGSTFKRPEGYFAGTLIDQTGLKGLSVGGAQVSTKHAGFVVNKGGATAADVINLIHEVQKRVKEAHGVELQPEVRLIGEK